MRTSALFNPGSAHDRYKPLVVLPSQVFEKASKSKQVIEEGVFRWTLVYSKNNGGRKDVVKVVAARLVASNDDNKAKFLRAAGLVEPPLWFQMASRRPSVSETAEAKAWLEARGKHPGFQRVLHYLHYEPLREGSAAILTDPYESNLALSTPEFAVTDGQHLPALDAVAEQVLCGLHYLGKVAQLCPFDFRLENVKRVSKDQWCIGDLLELRAVDNASAEVILFAEGLVDGLSMSSGEKLKATQVYSDAGLFTEGTWRDPWAQVCAYLPDMLCCASCVAYLQSDHEIRSRQKHWAQRLLDRAVPPSSSFVGMTPASSYVSMTPAISFVGVTPASSYVSVTPARSYVSVTPASSYVSVTPASSHRAAHDIPRTPPPADHDITQPASAKEFTADKGLYAAAALGLAASLWLASRS